MTVVLSLLLIAFAIFTVRTALIKKWKKPGRTMKAKKKAIPDFHALALP